MQQPEYQTVTVAEMHRRLEAMIRQRRDTGFRVAVTDALLDPRNPFEPRATRRPKTSLAIGAAVCVLIALVFLFYSFHRG